MMFCRGGADEIREGMRALFHIGKVEDPLAETAKETRLAIFEHVTPRTKQRRTRRKLTGKRDEIIFIPTRAVQEEQRGSDRVGAFFESVKIAEFAHD